MFVERDCFQQERRLSSQRFQSHSYVLPLGISLSFLFLSHLSIETISIGGIVRAAQGENRRLSRQIFDFVYSIFQKNDAAAISTPALSAKYYRWNSNVDMRGARRKRISSISQRVAVTVSVMAFGSVVESYSCANPIRALLRVYFRTRVARVYIVVVIVSCTHAFTEKQRQTGRLRTFYRIIHRSDSLMYPKKTFLSDQQSQREEFNAKTSMKFR